MIVHGLKNMKIEWFIQYYYSAEDIYKARKIQWAITMMGIAIYSFIIAMWPYEAEIQLYSKIIYSITFIMIFGILCWIFWGYEKAKSAYRKSMNECKNHVSKTMAYYWHTYDDYELSWKRDKWVTIPQVGLIFIFMSIAIWNIIRI